MELPSFLKDESLKRLLQGAAVGVAATAIIGFTWGGWQTGSAATKMAEESSSKAVAAALFPLCVAKFNSAPDAAATLIKLKATDGWQQESFVEKGGWAILAGKKEPYSGVSEQCAKALAAMK